MRKLILCLFLLIATACTSNQNNMRDFTYAGNIPVVGDTINNEVVHFIIDSGAGVSLINTDYYVNNKDLFRTLEEVEMMLFGIGLGLFMISDYFLMIYKFKYHKNWILRCNSGTYFIGLLMVVLSLMY